MGIGVDDLDSLDGNGVIWRRLYFMRQAVRTLKEAKGALMILNQSPEFQKALSDAGDGFRETIAAFERVVEAANVEGCT